MFVFQKAIDRSTLRQGFSIPVAFQPKAHMLAGGELQRGDQRIIKIQIGHDFFEAILKNQKFDNKKFQRATDIMQIRYNQSLAKRLQEIFSSSWEYVEKMKAHPENRDSKKKICIPEERQEFLVFHTTEIADVYRAECITLLDKEAAKKDIRQISEIDFETYEPKHDPTATIKESLSIKRIRVLDRSIGDSLKELYNYTCQMTGERIGAKYGTLVAEAHHIVPFTESMNNEPDNIMILSPNYHRIIHKAHPEFNRKNLSFVFPNGLEEKVMINQHL